MSVEDQTDCWKYILDDGSEVIRVEHVKDEKIRILLEVEVPSTTGIRFESNWWRFHQEGDGLEVGMWVKVFGYYRASENENFCGVSSIRQVTDFNEVDHELR